MEILPCYTLVKVLRTTVVDHCIRAFENSPSHSTAESLFTQIERGIHVPLLLSAVWRDKDSRYSIGDIFNGPEIIPNRCQGKKIVQNRFKLPRHQVPLLLSPFCTTRHGVQDNEISAESTAYDVCTLAKCTWCSWKPTILESGVWVVIFDGFLCAGCASM